MSASPRSTKNLFDRSLFQGRERRSSDATIDMTPMIDTLLQLFIVFMLNMTFVMSAVPLRLPTASASSPQPKMEVVVSLTSDHEIFINAQPVAIADLPDRVRIKLEQTQATNVVLRADGSLKYEQIVDVLLAIKRGGADNVELAYQEQ
jgi:biopolymer transport protein TolR